MGVLRTFCRTHKTLMVSVAFLVIFSFTIVRATPPTSPYTAGATLDPQCTPGSSNCTVNTTISLTTAGSSGAATLSGGVLNIPQYNISLTTNGSSGVANLSGNTLNIPQYISSQWSNVTGGINYSGGNVGINSSNPVEPFQVNGNAAFGDSVTVNNSVRALNLVATNAVMRIIRISPDSTTAAPSVELLHRTSADGTTDVWWDFFANTNGFSIRLRGTPDQVFFTINPNGSVNAGANNTVTSDINAFTAGNSNTVSNSYAIALGYGNTASGNTSVAIGNSTTASGQYGSAFNFSTNVAAYAAAAFGRYNLGGGTTSSWVTTDPLFEVGNGTGTGASAADALLILKNGNTGINMVTGTPSYSLQVGSTAVTGIVARFQNSTGTCDINPTGTALSCSSDMTLKTNITNLADNSPWSFNSNITIANQDILDKLLALNPVQYNWRTEQPGDAKHTGFIAQEVQQVFPDLVSQDPNTHLLSLNYMGLIPYTVEAVKEMNIHITSIDDLTKTNTWRDALENWFADTGNGIKSLVVHDQICVDDQCLTKDDIRQLLQMEKNSTTTTTATTITSMGGTSTVPATDTTATTTITPTTDTSAPQTTSPDNTQTPTSGQ